MCGISERARERERGRERERVIILPLLCPSLSLVSSLSHPSSRVVIDGQEMSRSPMDVVRATHNANPANSVIAFSDNAGNCCSLPSFSPLLLSLFPPFLPLSFSLALFIPLSVSMHRCSVFIYLSIPLHLSLAVPALSSPLIRLLIIHASQVLSLVSKSIRCSPPAPASPRHWKSSE